MDNEPMKTSGGKCDVCPCPHHKVKPWVTILLGVAILLYGLGIFSLMLMAVAVGALLIIKGITKLTGDKCSCCEVKKM